MNFLHRFSHLNFSNIILHMWNTQNTRQKIQLFSWMISHTAANKAWSGFRRISVSVFHPQSMVLIKRLFSPIPSGKRWCASRWVSIQVHWAKCSHIQVFCIHFPLSYNKADHRHTVSNDLSHSLHSTLGKSHCPCNQLLMNSSKIFPLWARASLLIRAPC